MKATIPFLRLLALVLFVSSVTTASAQVTKPKTTKDKAKVKDDKVKFNPSTIKTYLGKFTGKINVATVEEAKQVLALPLRLTDNKNNSYKISSYQFAYKKWGSVEDEITKEVRQQSTLSADRFTTTPLPEIWLTNINEGLHPGEELFFYDIIAFDKEGRRFFAPELKIVIQ
ncbi:MAG: hypothetical protein V4556_13855 [Bacteroidota bacterium]